MNSRRSENSVRSGAPEQDVDLGAGARVGLDGAGFELGHRLGGDRFRGLAWSSRASASLSCIPAGGT